jgi:hypothetical protein
MLCDASAYCAPLQTSKAAAHESLAARACANGVLQALRQDPTAVLPVVPAFAPCTAVMWGPQWKKAGDKTPSAEEECQR